MTDGLRPHHCLLNRPVGSHILVFMVSVLIVLISATRQKVPPILIIDCTRMPVFVCERARLMQSLNTRQATSQQMFQMVTGLFAPKTTFAPWNFRTLELLLPPTNVARSGSSTNMYRPTYVYVTVIVTAKNSKNRDLFQMTSLWTQTSSLVTSQLLRLLRFAHVAYQTLPRICHVLGWRVGDWFPRHSANAVRAVSSSELRSLTTGRSGLAV